MLVGTLRFCGRVYCSLAFVLSKLDIFGMEVESCCHFCCGDDLSGGEQKKRRGRLANTNFKESLSVLVYLASESLH